MPKRLGSKEVIRVLQEHGFSFVTQRGSHAKYKNAGGRIAIVSSSGCSRRLMPTFCFQRPNKHLLPHLNPEELSHRCFAVFVFSAVKITPCKKRFRFSG